MHCLKLKIKNGKYFIDSHQIMFADEIEIGTIVINCSVSPAAKYGGTWEKLPANYALWTTTSGAGGTVVAGLPNITGDIDFLGNQIVFPTSTVKANGSIENKTKSGTYICSYSKLSGTVTQNTGFSLNASKSSSIYGKSTTVQPPAYKVYAWKKVAN